MFMSAASPIRLAFIGSGVFARDAHLPAIKQLGDRFEVVAICSRTEESAARLAGQLPGNVATYTDIDALLQRDDIEAVNILLPINLLSSAVEKALKAGKHVISEKPITPNVAMGRKLIELHDQTDRV